MTGRGPGWPTVLALMVVALTFSVIHPFLLLLLPLALLLISLPPREPRLMAMGGVLALVGFLGAQDALWYVERGWALLLGGWFVVAVLVWPAGAFVVRGLSATAAAVGTGGVIIALTGSWPELDWTITTRYREAAMAMIRVWPGELGDPAAVVERAATLPAQVFPAMLAVASLASLAMAWWGYRRLTQRGRPLGRLPEFRFPDGLVWVLIAGLVLLMAPLAPWAPRAGSNLVFFMSALYALRGLAVVLALVGTHVPVLLMLALVSLVLYPIVMAGTLLVGLTDTWLDLRSGRRAVNEEG